MLRIERSQENKKVVYGPTYGFCSNEPNAENLAILRLLTLYLDSYISYLTLI